MKTTDHRCLSLLVLSFIITLAQPLGLPAAVTASAMTDNPLLTESPPALSIPAI